MPLVRLLVLVGTTMVTLATIGPFAGVEAADIIAIAPATAAIPSGKPASHTVSNIFAIEGKQVPLPPGEWVVAGEAPTSSPARPAEHPPVMSVVLFRLAAGRVDAAILFQTNHRRARVAWGTAVSCNRTDLYLARTRYASDHDGSCVYAAHVDTNVDKVVGIDPAWTMAMHTAATKNWHVPTSWVDVVYRITDPSDAIQVRYLFDPWGQESTIARQLSTDSIQSLTGWAESTWDVVETGFRNRIDDDAHWRLRDWPQSERSSPDLLSRKEALNSDQPATSQLGHLGVKMVTYRIFGTLTDLTVNYLWLGSLPSAGGLALIGAFASSSLYFVHELVWSGFEKPAEVAITLPGVGKEGPQSAHN